MATEYINLTGKAAWAYHLFQPDNRYKQWTVDLYFEPDSESLEAYNEAGIQLKQIKPEHAAFKAPLVGYRFKRRQEQIINGEKVTFDPPVVTDEEGNEFSERIGNGSILEINVAVYDTAMGKGHRLQSARVLELVPYEKSEKVEDQPKTAKSKKVKTPW